MMISRPSIALLTICVILFDCAHAQPIAGGWQVTTDEVLLSEMLALTQSELAKTDGTNSPSITVMKLERQVVAGTNLRLQFLSDDKKQCVLIAFKPLPSTGQPTEVKSLDCQEKRSRCRPGSS